MAPSRRRGPSAKTLGTTTARSAAIQAAEKRRREEQEQQAPYVSDSNKINGNYDETPTTTGVRVGYDEVIYLESTNNNDYSKNNTTTVGDYIEAGKKRKKFSRLPPFATGTSKTTSTANSPLSTEEVVVNAAKQLLNAQPFCQIVPEEQYFTTICDQRSKCEKLLYKRRQDFDYSERGYDDDDGYDDDEDEGCLHCHQKVKNMPRIGVIDDDERGENDSNGGYCGDSNIQVRCDDCRGYICNGCHWCLEFQANHEIRVCDRCDAFYCRGCDEMDQCDDCGEVVCGSCSTMLSCKFCGGGLCEDCATACGR